MSYGFLMMKPKAAIPAIDELSEDTLLQQPSAAIVQALSELFPDLTWQEENGGGWFGSLQGEDGWYEFRIGAGPEYAWSVRTSHGAGTRNLIPVICNALGLVAFDGQANMPIAPDERNRD